MNVFYDDAETGAIGNGVAIARQDEFASATPFCVTIDFDIARRKTGAA